jgi:invasion protein IalB
VSRPILKRINYCSLLIIVAHGAGAALFTLPLCVTTVDAQQRTMAIYGDWTLSCAIGGVGTRCGLVQVQKFGSQSSAVSEIGIGRSSRTEPFRVSIELPTDVWIPSGVKLFTEDKLSILTAAFKWCVATRCLADAEISDAEIASFRSQKAPGGIAYKTASQTDVLMEISFRGFGEAFKALQKQ